jgi:hypothetical protein
MSQITGTAKFARSAGNLLALVGFVAYLVGLFGPTRLILFIGIALVILSFVAFYLEEFEGRR